jgi:hypothetical protein
MSSSFTCPYVFLATQVVGLDGNVDDTDAMNTAATKVQAGWRGHQARKEVERMKAGPA